MATQGFIERKATANFRQILRVIRNKYIINITINPQYQQ